LEVHTSDRTFSDAEPHIRLYRHKVESVFHKFFGTPGSHEASTIILVRGRIDHPCADDIGLGKMHAVTVLRTNPTLSLMLA
jgi:hypothetical protein